MNRFRFSGIVATLLIAMTAAAQQSARDPGAAVQTPNAHASMSNADDHLRILSEKLDLTSEQQRKLRPIIQNMLDQRQQLMNDQTLSPGQRQEKQRALHQKADSEARKLLNEEQRKKLDELEAQHNSQSPAQAHP